MKFLRWREFHCLAAARNQFKWLVEWLHRRVIASAGAIAHTMALVQSIRLRLLDRIFCSEKNASLKSFVAKYFRYIWILCSESTTVGRSESKKLQVAEQWWCMEPKFRKFGNFENIEVGGVFGHQNWWNWFAGANFIACGGAKSIQVIRRVVAP